MNESGFTENSPETLQAILDSVLDAIIAIDDEGTILQVNPATSTMFGFAKDELIGQKIGKLMPEPYHSQHDGYLANYEQTGVAKIIGIGRDVEGLRKDGTTFPLHLAVNEIQVDGKRIFSGIVRDNSSLNERQARLEAIMNNAVDAIITIDEQGLIDAVNPATEKVFGYAADALIGENVKLLMPAPYREEHDGYIQNYCDTGIRKIIGIGREVTGRRKDGSTFPMHLAVSEIRLGDRRLFTGIVRDISDLKKVERELADMNEQLEHRVQLRTRQLREAQSELVRNEKFSTLGKVSGGIAHEIRNPLNAVKTSAYYLLNATHASPEKVREHLERIDRQVMLIDNVVTALSDVAKLPEAHLRELDLKPFISSAISSTALPGNIELTTEIEETLPDVLADESQMVIAFLNLIRNARDAMPNGGTMTVRCRAHTNYVELSVTDTGIGISAADLEKVLEPLFTTKARGMGLGLPITRAIVEKNQGTLHMESELGKGSCFSIHLKKV